MPQNAPPRTYRAATTGYDTASTGDGGCLAFFIPPLTILAVSLALVLALLNSSLPQNIAYAHGVSLAPVESQTRLRQEQPGIAPLFTPQVHHWETQIIAWALDHNLDPNLVATVMQIESCGDPLATSGVGAIGLFQVMPYHFANGESTYDPSTNAYRGLVYLATALQAKGGDPRLALAAYNGGITGTTRPEHLWPAETQRYTYWGENIYRDALLGKEASPTLSEWLDSGGSSLCNQASQRLGLDD